MIYLASPYSHPDELQQRTRFMLAEQATAKMLSDGRIVFSPIVHCHAIAVKYTLPTDFTFWQRYCIGMLTKASEFAILDIPGWRESKGVIHELSVARAMQLPVYMISATGVETPWQE